MQLPSEKKLPLSTSWFYMWRSLVAIAWADGKCGEEETEYFAKVFANLDRYYILRQDQRDTLANDLENPQDALALFAHINEPEPRGALACYAEDLVMLDGELHPNEEAIIKRLRLWGLPLEEKERLRGEIHDFIAKRRVINEAEKQAIRDEIAKRSPHVAALDRLLRRYGIDILFD